MEQDDRRRPTSDRPTGGRVVRTHSARSPPSARRSTWPAPRQAGCRRPCGRHAWTPSDTAESTCGLRARKRPAARRFDGRTAARPWLLGTWRSADIGYARRRDGPLILQCSRSSRSITVGRARVDGPGPRRGCRSTTQGRRRQWRTVATAAETRGGLAMGTAAGSRGRARPPRPDPPARTSTWPSLESERTIRFIDVGSLAGVSEKRSVGPSRHRAWSVVRRRSLDPLLAGQG